jgi:ribA/ribD-fused uncharacterized protein
MQFSKQTKSFSGKLDFLSNFYLIDIFYNGIKYPSVENAYQSAKSFDPTHKFRAANCSPGASKRLGKQSKIREDWETVKVGIMEELLRQKFQNKNLQQKLLEVKDDIVEGNYWHDNFWGDCYCDSCKKIKGKNILGNLLMKIRGELTSKKLLQIIIDQVL